MRTFLLTLILLALLAPALCAKLGACTIEGGAGLPPYPELNEAGECKNAQAAAGCGGKTDIVYVIDGSGSVAEEDYAKMIEFLQELSSMFQIDKKKVQIAVVQYAGSDSMAGCTTYQFNEATGVATAISSPSCPIAPLEKFVVQDLSGDASQICATLDAPQVNYKH